VRRAGAGWRAGQEPGGAAGQEPGGAAGQEPAGGAREAGRGRAGTGRLSGYGTYGRADSSSTLSVRPDGVA